MRQDRRWLSSAFSKIKSLPGAPLVEAVGQRRILIENHCGVMAYSQFEICAKVKYGVVCVCGKELQLARMTKEQLIITGLIEEIKLMGGKC